MTREQALERAKFWVDRQYCEPDRWERNASRDLAAEMTMRAVAAALRNGESTEELDEKLVYCIRLIENLRLAGRSIAIRNIFDKREEEQTKSEKMTVSLYRDAVWLRYNVAHSFQLGDKSQAYFDGWDEETINHLAAGYLSRPWARHGMVDWILLDMMITRETCAYGEQIKMAGLPGIAGDYFKHGGNLAKMRGDIAGHATEFLIKLVLFALGWVIPLAAIRLAFQHGYETTGWVLVALFALSTIWWLIGLALRFGIRVYWYATGKQNPANRPFEVHTAMCGVWRLLEGAVVNPTMVKGEMLKAKEKGAVWDGAAWSIIDRAITIDPAVMVTTTNRYH